MSCPTILIADDEQAILIHVADVVENNGYLAKRLVSGREVLATVATKIPDIIILNWNIPEMGGLETLKRLKANLAVDPTKVSAEK